MPLYARRAVVLAKTESPAGQDANPTGAANSIAVANVNLSPLNLQTQDRGLLRPYLGGSEQIVTGEYAEIEFEVEAAGAGTSATTVSKFGPLLKACGMAETVGASDVSYLPVSTSFSTVTIYCYIGDSVLHKITGAMGDVTAEFVAGEIPKLKFRFLGIYNAVTDASSSGVAYTGWQVPVGFRDAVVPTLTVHGLQKTAPIGYRSISVGLGNNLVYRNLIGSVSALITDRAAAGSVELEAATIATKDWFGIVRGLTTAAITLQVNSTATNIFQVDAPKVQMTNPRYSELDGIVMMTLDMRMLPSSGNDEVKFSTK